MKEIKWAVLGCGVIANEMAVALQKNGKNIYAVGNRTHEKAAAFAEKYGIGKVYDDFHEMFTDPEVDVIYITTPHNTHLGFMKEAIANGKHILVEKSITLNSDELDEAIALAKEKGVIIGEAMTIYHMPIYKELKKILDSGRLGRVNLITMSRNAAWFPVRTDLSRSWSTRVPGKQKSQTLPPANPKSSKPVTTPMHSPMSSPTWNAPSMEMHLPCTSTTRRTSWI